MRCAAAACPMACIHGRAAKQCAPVEATDSCGKASSHPGNHVERWRCACKAGDAHARLVPSWPRGTHLRSSQPGLGGSPCIPCCPRLPLPNHHLMLRMHSAHPLRKPHLASMWGALQSALLARRGATGAPGQVNQLGRGLWGEQGVIGGNSKPNPDIPYRGAQKICSRSARCMRHNGHLPSAWTTGMHRAHKHTWPHGTHITRLRSAMHITHSFSGLSPS